MSERLMLEGALQEKKMQSINLATRAEGLIRALKISIQPASITPLKDLRTDEIRELAIELDSLRIEYVNLTQQMTDISRELGK
jgi:hypothetical protein